MGGPSGDQLIRVDMTEHTVSIEAYPDEWKLCGGRALSAIVRIRVRQPA